MTDVEVHLSKLTQAVKRAYPLLEGEDIAEAVWLSQFMDFVSEEPKLEIPEAKAEQKNEPETPKPLENPLPEQPSEPDSPEASTATDVTSEPDNIPLYAESSKADGTSQGGQPIRVPGVRMLQDRLLLERALRPLRRQVLSRQYFELDEAATIDASAEQNIITPVLKGKAERWLDAHIVIDCGLSMIVWRETLHELTLLFKNSGIYENVQVWYLFTDEEKAYLTASNQTEARHCNPAELLNPRKQQLVLMCTDCASSAWFSGSVTKNFLSCWQDKMPVAMIQMLPQRLWLGTALRNSELLNFTSSNPAALNKCLVNDDSWFDEDEQVELMQLPVITIDPISLDALAKVLIGSKGQWVSGVLVEQGAFPIEFTKESEKLSAEQRLQRFRQQASPLARKLAEYFSCIPLTLPVMRMIQNVMLPASNQTHLAEFFLGGLIKPVVIKSDFVEYEFHGGVREQFWDLLPQSLIENIALKASAHINNCYDKVFDFRAFIFGNALSNEVLGEIPLNTPFAYLSGKIFDRLSANKRKVNLLNKKGKIEKKLELVAELLLKLTEPQLTQQADNSLQLSARAELSHLPANLDSDREVKSPPFRLTAPIGQIEQDELRWYLEKYYQWPVGLFHERAQRIEAQLSTWGKALYAAALGKEVCREVVNAWQQARGTAINRRFSVQVEISLLDDASEGEKVAANKAATRWQALPWELLHDGKGYLSDGVNPVRICRRLPNFQHRIPRMTALPIRILLLSPRPQQAGYIDHRASALPLVKAIGNMENLVQLTVLTPPTWDSLKAELRAAHASKTPYHIVHFDGHGIFDAKVGKGALVFEHPLDNNKLLPKFVKRVYADELATLLAQYHIPLVFLEAAQTAQSDEDPNASVAAALLHAGVASVIAMSHSVLMETARRFVSTFYEQLAAGQSISSAVLAGRQSLMKDTDRIDIAGAGKLRMQDWFVPILYQEQHDPQLFARIPSATVQLMTAQQRQTRLGRLPEPPPHSFIGRSRELLQVERLLEQQPYAVLRGQGGAGKTTLAVELARWLVQSRRFGRCAFVSVEQYNHPDYVLEQLLQQLVNPNHNFAAEYTSDADKALEAIRRVLENERVLIVVDNVEALLADEGNVAEVFGVLVKLLPHSHLLFTTREALPAPFHHKAREIMLGALSVTDAKALVMQAMNNEGLRLRHDDQGNTPQEVDDLVVSVGCHARALVLLARELAQRGVNATTANVRAIMQALEQRHPGQRELSLFASVELSLRRLSLEVRGQIAGLAVFQDGSRLENMATVLDVGTDRMRSIGEDLVQVGLAQPIGDYSYLRLDPAMPAYLDLGLTAQQREGYRQRWREVIGQLVEFLYQQRSKDTKLQAQLTQLELPNLMVYLQTLMADLQAGSLVAEVVVDKAGGIEQLLANLHQPQALAQVVAWRKQAAQALSEWSNARFQNEFMNVQRLLQQGDIQAAFQAAQGLLQQCQQAGEHAYAGADYDLAMAHILLGRVLETSGTAVQALSYLQEAQQRFEALGKRGANMASAALMEQGDCLQALGQLEAAAAAYENAIAQSEKLKDTRQVALGKIQLATTHLNQKRYADALQGYQQALLLFQQLDEPNTMATAWHQIGITHMYAGDFEQAEQAYRQSLSIASQLGSKASEARSLNGLGNLYGAWNHSEQAVSFYRQAAAIHVALGDLRYEGVVRSNLADTLIKLQRYEEARLELLRAIECKQAFGHAAEPWKTWGILHNLEQVSGNPLAAKEARQQALAAFMAYRRDGGENHSGAGRLALVVGLAIQQGDMAEVKQQIERNLQVPAWQENKNFLYKLQAMIAGERSLDLVEDEDLSYDSAVELLILLEKLRELGQ